MNPDPKPKTYRNKKYLNWLKTQPCVYCGNYASPAMDVVPMHQGGGMALKGDDSDALPGCVEHHRWEHNGPATFWAMVKTLSGKSRDQIAVEHWERYQNEKQVQS